MRISCSRHGRASNVCMVLVCRYRRCGVAASSWHVQTVMRSPRCIPAFCSYQSERTRLQKSSPLTRRHSVAPASFIPLIPLTGILIT